MVTAFKELTMSGGRQTLEETSLMQSAKCCEGRVHVGSSGRRLPGRGDIWVVHKEVEVQGSAMLVLGITVCRVQEGRQAHPEVGRSRYSESSADRAQRWGIWVHLTWELLL